MKSSSRLLQESERLEPPIFLYERFLNIWKGFTVMAKGNGTTFYLSEELVPLVDKLKQRRQDSTRAATLRFLILRSLAELGYLQSNQKKALGLLSSTSQNSDEENAGEVDFSR